MKQSANQSKNAISKRLIIVWGSAFFLLALYYAFIQWPMEKSFIQGITYLRDNKPIEAAQEFDKVLKVYPKYEPVYLNVAAFAIRNGKNEEGQERYRYARRLCLINSEIFSERGLVYAQYSQKLTKGAEFYNEHVLKNYSSTILGRDEKN